MLHLVLTRAMGFFAEERLNVEIVPFKGSANLVQQMLAGRVQIGQFAPERLVTSGQGDGLAFFYNMDRASRWEMVVRHDGAIRSLQDLKGRRIGVGALTYNSIPVLRAMLADAGAGPGEGTKIVAVGNGAGALRSLIGRQVDALHLLDVQYAQLQEGATKMRRLDIPAKLREPAGERLYRAAGDDCEGHRNAGRVRARDRKGHVGLRHQPA